MEIPVQGLDQQPEGEGESGTQLCSAGSALSFLLKCRSGGGGWGRRGLPKPYQYKGRQSTC